jgi:hypothetical protein
MAEQLELGFFEPHVNTTFTLKAGDTTIDLELIEAREVATQATQPEGARKPFSLIFRAPQGTALEQQIFQLEHAQAGELEIFLVPVQPDEKGPCYEAVFN